MTAGYATTILLRTSVLEMILRNKLVNQIYQIFNKV